MSSILKNLDTISAKELALKNEIEQDPNNPEPHLNLAAWLRRHSRAREAVEHYETALTLKPHDSTVAVKLAATLIEAKEFLAADSLLQKLAALTPPAPGTFYEIGKLCFLTGRVNEAVSCLHHALDLEPANAECCAFLGHVLTVIGNKEQAMGLFQRSAELDPKAGEPWRHMGLLVQEQTERADRFALAEKYLKTACERQPDNPVFECAYADLLLKLGRQSEAVEHYAKARATDPAFPLAIAGTVTALERLGELTAAAEFARDALDRYPHHLRIIQAFATVARHIGEEARAIELLESTLGRPDINDEAKVDVHFALGALYDRIKSYEKAFPNFERANSLCGFRLDREDEERRIRSIIDAFPASLQRKRARASNRSRVPIFIVGMPRSGTTLVEQILASHPLVHGAGELENISEISKRMHQTLGVTQPYPFCMADLTRRQLDILAESYLKHISKLSRGLPRVTDKMPHNFVSLGLIDLLFPEARVIHCRRDARDNCVAIFTQRFNKQHGYATNLADLGYYYRLYQSLMEHWRATIRVPMLELTYEDLVAEPERHIREIISFSGLPWDERCLRFHETKREVNTISYDQVRRPIYKTSAGRWRNYEAFLSPLLDSLGFRNTEAESISVSK